MGLGEIYEDIVSGEPGLTLLNQSKALSEYGPRASPSTQHIMLHLNQDKVYGATEADVDLLADILLNILKQPAFNKVFADPTWDAVNPNKVNVTTTATGVGCLYPI